MLGVVGILLSLALLMWLAFRGITVLVLAPLLALLAVLLNGDTRLLGLYTQVFMTGLGGFLVKYFPLFLLGAIFGQLMRDSGSADVIARSIINRLGGHRAVLALVLSCGILTYGGISVFVVIFAAYPIGAAMFRRAGIPKRLIPAAGTLGAGTFTMTALPGTPSIQNAIPMPYFGTDLYAAPVLGIVAGTIMLLGGMFWLNREVRLAAARGEGYGDHPIDAAEPGEIAHPPTLITALAPLLLVVGGNYLMTRFVIPAMNTDYLAEVRFGKVTLNDVRGLWSLIAAMTVAIALTALLHRRRWADLRGSINRGTMGSLLPIFNTASEVGYGTVVASLAGFAVIRDAMFAVAPGNPLVSEAIAVNVMAGITGSASGGLGIALAAMGQSFQSMATAAGVSPELLHRVAALAAGGLDSLPHNGAIITTLAICHLTHRESYREIFVTSVVVPLLALAVVLLAAPLFS
ncbi:MAG: GntP family permease [Gemmatimonadales bacterium]